MICHDRELLRIPTRVLALEDKHVHEHRWDGAATVRNVRQAVRTMVHLAQKPEDRVVFVTSSHGAGDGKGNSHLCLLPYHFVRANDKSKCI